MTKDTLKKDTLQVNVFTAHSRIADKFVSTDSVGNSEQNPKDAVISKTSLHDFIFLLLCLRVVLTEVYNDFVRMEGMREVHVCSFPFHSGR